ncbi:Uncharacterised protein [Vibrio cholerae]|nr:Uncharacterised protein [Vibrio cholerae]
MPRTTVSSSCSRATTSVMPLLLRSSTRRATYFSCATFGSMISIPEPSSTPC